jgi:predicted AlkP superfamily pyrophosphatase or phosphodiesterase
MLLADGLRPDAITIDRMPSLYELGANFAHARYATTVRPSTTVAALTSLATGLSPKRHGLLKPGLSVLSAANRVEPLPRTLRDHGCVTSVVTADLPFFGRSVTRALTSLAGVWNLTFSDPDPRSMARATAAAMERTTRGLVVTYMPHCDRAGHAHGWMSAEYLEAASIVDRAIGLLASLVDGEFFIVVSDHGGGGITPRDHDLPHPTNDRIPVVLAGKGLPPSITIDRTVSLLDIPATIVEALGVTVPSCYQGRSLLHALTPQEAIST